MKVSVTSTVVFDVPNDSSLEQVKANFVQAHVDVLGRPMVTTTGQHYTLVGIEKLEIERQSK